MPSDDAQRVAADRQRPEVPDALGGAGDGQRVTGGTSGRSSLGEQLVDVVRRTRPRRSARVQTTGASSWPSMAEHLGAVGDVVAARWAASRPWLDGDAAAAGRPSMIVVEGAGEARRTTGRSGRGSRRSTGSVSRAGSVVTKTTSTSVAVGVVEPGHRARRGWPSRPGRCRGSGCSRRRPASAACRCRRRGERLRPSVSVSGVAATSYGGSSTGAGERRVPTPTRRPQAGEQHRSSQRRPATRRRTAGARLAHGVPRRRGPRSARAAPASPPAAVVGVVEQRADEGRADDHPVGVRRDLGRLVAVADAEPDADRQVGGRAGCGRRAGRRGRWWWRAHR